MDECAELGLLNTYLAYEYCWSLLAPHIGNTRVKRLRAVDLDHAYAAITKNVSPNTTIKAAKHVTALLNQATRWELIQAFRVGLAGFEPGTS
jgi:hypothetical protein